MSNPFESLSDNATRHTRRKIERENKAPMVPSPAEKAQRERAEQVAQYKRWKAEVRRGMAAGIYGPEIIMLFRLLRRFPSSQQLVDWVQGSQWLLDASRDTRREVMGWIGAAIMRWNIRHGLPPFDDGLPHEPDTPYVQIRRLLIERDN